MWASGFGASFLLTTIWWHGLMSWDLAPTKWRSFVSRVMTWMCFGSDSWWVDIRHQQQDINDMASSFLKGHPWMSEQHWIAIRWYFPTSKTLNSIVDMSRLSRNNLHLYQISHWQFLIPGKKNLKISIVDSVDNLAMWKAESTGGFFPQISWSFPLPFQGLAMNIPIKFYREV